MHIIRDMAIMFQLSAEGECVIATAQGREPSAHGHGRTGQTDDRRKQSTVYNHLAPW